MFEIWRRVFHKKCDDTNRELLERCSIFTRSIDSLTQDIRHLHKEREEIKRHNILMVDTIKRLRKKEAK